MIDFRSLTPEEVSTQILSNEEINRKSLQVSINHLFIAQTKLASFTLNISKNQMDTCGQTIPLLQEGI